MLSSPGSEVTALCPKRRSNSFRTLAKAVERAPTSVGYLAWEWLSEPVRVLSEAADVHETYAFELGTLPQATEHRHDFALQHQSWERDPRRQLYFSSSRHGFPTTFRGIGSQEASLEVVNVEFCA